MSQEQDNSEVQKERAKAKRGKRREISLAPLKLLESEFTKNLEERSDNLMEAEEVRRKCFQVLSLIDQYHRPPQTKEELQTVERQFSAEDTRNVDAYLTEDDNGNETAPEGSAQETAQAGSFSEQHQQLIVARIRALLQFPQVKERLFNELQREAGYYESNKDMLERLKNLRRARLKALREMHRIYLDSKKKHKKLIASASVRIGQLTQLEKDARQEETGIKRNAEGPASGLITAQELLRYKRQIQERGFALTESRQDILNWIAKNAMAGRKVFLVGSTGTGKTELMLATFHELGNGKYEIVSWHEGTTPRDVLGQTQIRQVQGNGIESRFQPGPLIRAYQSGTPVGHEEITGGTTRTMLGLKYLWNRKSGDKIQLGELEGEEVNVEDVIEILTGNPKSETTKEREELDPAILRMLKGKHVSNMPPNEMAKIALANLIEENGVLELSKEEVKFIQNLADAASLMQQCHDGALSTQVAEELKKATGLEDLRLTKNFLDQGTFFALFSKYDFEKARGRSFKDYIAEQLKEFMNDPKTLGAEEERKVLLAVLQLKGVVSETSTLENVEAEIPESQKKYLLPSELGFINEREDVLQGDEFASEEEKRAAALVRKLSDTASRFPSSPDHLPEDAKRWCESLLDDQESGYDMAKDTVNIVLDSAKREVCPPKEQVKEALLRTLTKEQIEELQKLHEPTLLIVPDTTAAKLQAAVDKPACKTMSNQNDAHFEDFYTNALSAIATQNSVPDDQLKITKYRFVITEGKQHFDAQDGDYDTAFNKRVSMKNEDRVVAFEAYLQAQPGLVSQNAAIYMMLMIRGLKGGNPTDRISDTDWQFTLLPGEPKNEHVKNGLVAYGLWSSDLRRAFFGGDALGNEFGRARLRAAVMGEIS